MKNEFDTQYQSLIKKIISEGCPIKDGRTKETIIPLPGQTMQFDLRLGFPLLTLRRIPLKLFIAEQIWFLTGAKKLDFLQQYTRIWDDFREDDNTISSAYGYRWRKHFGRDQITGAIKLLEKDPTSRHAVIMMWDAADDGLNDGTAKKNVPCPYSFTLQIINNRLCLHLIIRSNDMMLGNPHDTSGFALLAYIFAEKLGVPPGILTISISNAHIYQNHLPQAKEIAKRKTLHPPIPFSCPKNALERAQKEDKSLITEIFTSLKKNYHPQPPLQKMKIAL